MKEFVIVGLIALIITPILATLNVFGLKQDPAETMAPKPFNVSAKIIYDPGVIGCRSKEALADMGKYAAKNNYAAMEGMMNERVCVFFDKGRVLTVREGACVSGGVDGDVFVSIPSKMTSEFFMPCSALGVIPAKAGI